MAILLAENRFSAAAIAAGDAPARHCFCSFLNGFLYRIPTTSCRPNLSHSISQRATSNQTTNRTNYTTAKASSDRT
ncbi:hypothetical protein [Escherichia coli]|uniref:hypothetical protein n=1 Tax=Escherichia coli TaxID=562 RepID=UPI00202131C3|nr:hypothetical protein [Escherichia coli]